MKTRMRFIKEILFAASGDEGRAMDLMEGPETSSTGRELFLWHFLDFRRQSER